MSRRNGAGEGDRPVRAGVYARRSVADDLDDDQKRPSASVTDQITDCNKRATALGWTVVETYPEDATSAWQKRKITLPDGRRVLRNVRPIWQQMLSDLYSGHIDALIVHDLDRAMREPRDLVDLIEIVEAQGRQVESVTGSLRLATDTDILAASIGVAVANKSSRDTSRRVSRAALRRAEAGEWHGGRVAPPGYLLVRKPDGKFAGLKLDPVQAPILQEGARRLLTGESLYSICMDWNNRGLTTRAGAHWHTATVRRSLLSPTAIAKRTHKDAPGKLFDTTWPALLDRDTWDKLHDLMRDPKRKRKGPLDGSYAGKYPLNGGVTVCGNPVPVLDKKGRETGELRPCGQRLYSQRHRGKVRLMCNKALSRGCGGVLIAYEPLERFVLDMIMEALDTPGFRKRVNRPASGKSDETSSLRMQIDDLDRQRRRVGDAVTIGAYTKSEAADKVRDIDEQRQRLEDKLSSITSSSMFDDIRSGSDAARLWASADVSKRRRFASSLISEVVVTRFPKDMTTTLTRRRGESDIELAQRRSEHERAALRARVEIRWRH